MALEFGGITVSQSIFVKPKIERLRFSTSKSSITSGCEKTSFLIISQITHTLNGNIVVLMQAVFRQQIVADL
jgi:hypothetical protein